MTLATTIHILDPHPPEPLFRFCRALLDCGPEIRWTHREAPGPLWPNGPIGPASMANVLGQGLPAIINLDHATDSPLIDTDYTEPGEIYDPRPRCLEVGFDTAYGYRTPNGAGCGDLHAWLVVEVGRWFEERRLRYRWNDECGGGWYDSIIHVGQLGDPDRGRLRDTPTDPPPLPPAETREVSA